jgi:phosphoserine phosphatase
MTWTAIFDVCDTLFSTNTTLGFLRFHAERSSDGRMPAALARWASRSSPAFYLGAAAHRLLGWDLARARLLKALKGQPRSTLEEQAGAYVEQELASRMVQPVHERLNQHLERGDRVLLASSSLDLVIAPVAERLGVEWVASTLQFIGGRCTGRLAPDLTGRKARATAALVGPTESVHVYTDNRSDGDLLRLAKRCTIILPPDAPGTRWAGEGCEYLPL